MGQKTHPYVTRIGINKTWKSSWFSRKKDYSVFLKQDFEIREYLQKKLMDSGIAYIKIMRPQGKVGISIYTSKPGVIIGRSGENIDVLRSDVNKKFGIQCELSVKEIKQPMLNADLVADDIARQIERRIPYRRAVKNAIEKSMQAGSKGIKVFVTGRLNGVEISRGEFFKEGRIPLHTFRSGIEFAHKDSNTTYGIIGVNVWIYTGEIFDFDFVNN